MVPCHRTKQELNAQLIAKINMSIDSLVIIVRLLMKLRYAIPDLRGIRFQGVSLS